MAQIRSRSLLRDEVLELGHGRGVLLAVLRAAAIGGACLGALYAAERLAPIAAFALQIVVYARVALWLKRVLENGRDGRPYAESFWRYILPAASVIGASVLYIMVSSGGAIRDETFRVIPLIAVMPIALYLLLTGGRMIQLAVRTLRMDRMLLIDQFRPERGSLVTSGIYGLLRHPFDAGLTRIALVLALIDGSVYGLLLAAVFVLGWQACWLRTEENVLHERYGEAYAAYSKGTSSLLSESSRKEFELAKFLVRPSTKRENDASCASAAALGGAKG